MKKLLVCVAALGMLFTSCMRDETRLDEGSVVSFNISAPAVSTRAAIEDTYGTGVAAEELHWAIFEADENGAAVGDVIFEDVVEDFFADGTLENTFNVRLVKGKSYVGMFWAQAPDAPYTVAWPEVTIGEVNSNDENLDAFFNIHKFSITAGQETGEQKVELRRPFAQLNVAIPATDLAAAEAAGFDLAKTGVSLEAAKSLNLVTGLVGDVKEVTYALTDMPSDVIFIDTQANNEEYQVISFNYVLVDGDAWSNEADEGQELKNITFNYAAADGEELSQTFQNIAVERNHRTYIVGNLLSETVDFRVIILPDWEDPYYLNNMEAGSIEMVAEQTKASNTGLGVATLTWNAVEGAEYYGVEYKSEELGKVNPDGTTRADEAATTVTWNTPAGKVTDATASFTIKAYDENDKVIARVVTEPIPVFSLADVRTPKMVIENNILTVNDCYNLSSVMMDLTVNFKNKEGVVKYSARHYKNHTNDTDPNANAWGYDSGSQINAGRFTKKYYYSFANDKTWMWTLADGSTVNSTTLPEMAAGEYTVEYTATYYAILNGYWGKKISSNPSVYGPADSEADSDRVMFDGLAADVCTATEPITGKLGTYKVAGFGGTVTAVAEGYQGAKLTWDAADGAAKYEVYVGDEKVAESTTNEATVTGLDKARKYTFTIKAYNEGGAKLPGEPTSSEIEIYTLLDRPAPEMSLENGVLTVATDLDHAKNKMGNIHQYGVMMAAEVYFYKDGATTPAYTAKANAAENGGGTDYPAAFNATAPYVKNNLCVPLTKWAWAEGDGEFGALTATAPTFAPGTYTVKIKGSYVPAIGAYYAVSGKEANYADADRIYATSFLVTAVKDNLVETLKTATLRTDDIAGSITVNFETKVEIAGLYQAAKLTWNPIPGASYSVAYGTTEACDEGTVNPTENTVTINNLKNGRKYYFKLTAGSETATLSTEIFTLYDYNPSFEIVKQENGSWKLNMYRLSYKAGAFHRIAFKIKEQGSDAVIYEEQGAAGEVGHIALDPHVKGWTSHYYIPWINQTDANWSTEAGKKLAGITFKAGTTYVVEYTAYLIPGVPAKSKEDYVAGCQAAGFEPYPDSYKQADIDAGTIFFFSAMLRDFDNIPSTTGTMEFTTAQ